MYRPKPGSSVSGCFIALLATAWTVERVGYGNALSKSAPVFRQAVEPVEVSGTPASTTTRSGIRPLRDASRAGERVNGFSCDYPQPDRRGTPFSIATGPVRSACTAVRALPAA